MIKTFLSRPLWVQQHVGNHLLELDEKLEDMGFELRTVGTNVTAFASPFDEVVRVLKTCDCAIILGLPYLRVRTGTLKDKEIGQGFALPSEWNQIEAAIAIMLGKPTLMMPWGWLTGLFDRGAANVFDANFIQLAQSGLKTLFQNLWT